MVEVKTGVGEGLKGNKYLQQEGKLVWTHEDNMTWTEHRHRLKYKNK